MEMKEIEALVKEAVRDCDLHPGEIPAIDLYLDQITSLASEKLKEGSPHFYDRVLTKTMINNYSKDGLIAPTKGKKYSKEHIIQMLLVYSMKNTLSIGEIKRILQNIYHLEGYSSSMLESVYTRFLEIKATEREGMWESVQEFIGKSDLDPSDEADFFTLLLGMAAVSAYYKSAVQLLLESRYPDLALEREREEQERREEAKQQTRAQKVEKKAAKAKKSEGAPLAEEKKPQQKAQKEEKKAAKAKKRDAKAEVEKAEEQE